MKIGKIFLQLKEGLRSQGDWVQLLVMPYISDTGLFHTFHSDRKKMFASFGSECILCISVASSLGQSLLLNTLFQC